MKKKKEEKVFFISDLHYPGYDKKAFKLLLKVIKKEQPTEIVFGGDMVDCFIASRFAKEFTEINIQKELDGFIKEIYIPILKQCKKPTEFVYLEGNHELRMESRAMDEQAFSELRVLKFGNLLDDSCTKYKVPHLLYKDERLFYSSKTGKPFFLMKHGNKACKYTANKELELEDISGCSGHVHKFDVFGKVNRGGYKEWNCVGHLLDVSKAKYMKKHSNKSPNWRQGFGILTIYNKSDTFNFTPVKFDEKYRCFIDGGMIQ